MTNAVRFPLVLGLICIVSATGVASVYVLTRDRIAEQQSKKQQEALVAIFGEGATEKTLNPDAPPDDRVGEVHAPDGALLGYVALGVGQGYSSRLRVIVGTDPDVSRILAIRILFQSETPGLGARVEEVRSNKTWAKMLSGQKVEDQPGLAPWFQAQFADAPLRDGAVDPSRIDTISGATISSKATMTAANEAVRKILAVVHPAREGEHAGL